MELDMAGRGGQPVADIFSQNCGVQRLNQTNIAEVLDWSGQPYPFGSAYRQVHQFLLEDFATNPGKLERIGKKTLRSVLCSNYLQCSEAELVAATVVTRQASRWYKLLAGYWGVGQVALERVGCLHQQLPPDFQISL